jgi:hypothetical protein
MVLVTLIEDQMTDDTAESVLPPPKQFVSEDVLAELWDTRGLKYRVDEFHQMLLQRGLGNYVHQVMFRKIFRDILHQFLVDGEARRDPRRQPRQYFPKVH